jgi:hypothetical protein
MNDAGDSFGVMDAGHVFQRHPADLSIKAAEKRMLMTPTGQTRRYDQPQRRLTQKRGDQKAEDDGDESKENSFKNSIHPRFEKVSPAGSDRAIN